MTTKTLSAKGTIYIDGSAKVANGAVNTYNGQAAIYLSGTFLLDGKLCGAVSGGNCDFAGWNPNTEMLIIVANGTGGQVLPADSIQLANNGQFEGGLFRYREGRIRQQRIHGRAGHGQRDHPLEQRDGERIPTITTVPVGMPSNPAVYAQPNPPHLFAG